MTMIIFSLLEIDPMLKTLHEEEMVGALIS